MTTDATITQTNKDFFTGSSLAIPAALIGGGAYFWFKNHPDGNERRTRGEPKDSDVVNVLALSAGTLGAFILWRMWRREHPPIVGGLPLYQGPSSLPGR